MVSYLLLLGLVGLSLFQIFLIVGKPWGEYAWGGQHKILPRSLRIGSIVSLLIYALMAMVFVERGGVADTVLSEQFADVATWVITAYFALGIVMNGISRSKKERNLWTPIVALLAGLSLALALS